MGIFGNKKDNKETKLAPKKAEKSVKAEAKEEKKPTSTKPNKAIGMNKGAILINPRITEKAAHISDQNVYTFNISERATKPEIKKAITEIYKVTPLKINISRIPYKTVRRRGQAGVKGGGRKAMVFLKKGDKIEFV